MGDVLSTPVRRQYLEIKARHPDAILFFRLGDFYETFDEDAKLVSRELGVTLTSKPLGKGLRVPLAGVPVASVEGHLARLVAKGHRVAICEQLNAAGEIQDKVPGKDYAAKRLVRRGVVRIVSPGTALEPALLAGGRSNYCAALIALPDSRSRQEAGTRQGLSVGYWGLAAADLSTGEFHCCEFRGPDAAARCAAELELLAPTELLQPQPMHSVAATARSKPPQANDAAVPLPLARVLAELGPVHTPRPPAQFQPDAAAVGLLAHYRLAAIDGLGLGERPAALAAAGALLAYLQESQAGELAQLERPRLHEPGAYMRLDGPTLRALSLFEDWSGGASTQSGSGSPTTLLGVLDRTRTAAGRRLLRDRLARPLLELGLIEARLDRVQLFRERPLLRVAVREELGAVPDLERLLSRTVAGLAPPPEVVRLGAGLASAARLGQIVAKALREVGGGADRPAGEGTGTAMADPLPAARVEELREVFADELCPAAAAQEAITARLEERQGSCVEEGGVLRPGADSACDTFRTKLRAARAAIAELETEERRRSGIANLKIGYHRTFGYYFEVSKSGLALVPSDYERRQTLAGGERFVTPKLRALEAEALEAREALVARERELLAQLRRELGEQAAAVRALARGVARLDVDCALAAVTAERDYTRPCLDRSGVLAIRAGRHPIVEAAASSFGSSGLFVPNDIELQAGSAPGPPQLLVLTGPNMGGKSTYLRQSALIVLMAQCGSFVPAAAARIGLVDRVFARVGAHDRLAAGQSTFMVEMLESAAILASASERSLLVLDEIGRGTSTYDGLAVAQALLEHLVEFRRDGSGGGPRTLFATHFHELTALAGDYPRVANAHVAVDEGKASFEPERSSATSSETPSAADLRFLYKVQPGAADRSYGLQVAAMAGLPVPLLARAGQLLRTLEADAREPASLPAFLRAEPPVGPMAGAAADLAEHLAELDIDAITPLEAIAALYALRDQARRALGDASAEQVALPFGPRTGT